MGPREISSTASAAPAGTCPARPARHLWTLSILGAALWYPFLTLGTALYAVRAARRLRRSGGRAEDESEGKDAGASSSPPPPTGARETGPGGTPRRTPRGTSRGTSRGASRSLGGVAAFDLALLLLGVAVYARAPGSLHRGLVPFGPLVALVVPLLERWGII